jgi:hypothetical protein
MNIAGKVRLILVKIGCRSLLKFQCRLTAGGANGCCATYARPAFALEQLDAHWVL